MNGSSQMTKDELAARLEPYGQEHVLAFWDELDEASRARLADEICAIDLAQIESLYKSASSTQDWATLARRAEPPPALRLGDRAALADEACRLGREALAGGKIGVLVTAGGQGSRLGFDQAKGVYPIGPVSGAALLEIHLKKALAASRRFGAAVPVYVMNSPATEADQTEFLAENDRFGLAEDDLFLFCQGTMPAVDESTGKLLLAEKDRLFLSPDGHGGTVAALTASGAIEHMRRRGVEHLFYLQVDNPLVPICDAEFIGHHLRADSDLTSMAVAKQGPHDKVGNFASIDGRIHVIEYSDLPDDVAERRDAEGQLVFWGGSIAVHVFRVDFLAQAAGLDDALPFHVAHKRVPYIDADGQHIEPERPNALKFEQFIFDLLPRANNAVVVEYAEEDVFAPLKNAPGAERDTPEYVQRMMVALYRRWLEAAGVEVVNDAAVEICPLWALDAADVAARVEPGTLIDEAIYLVDD